MHDFQSILSWNRLLVPAAVRFVRGVLFGALALFLINGCADNQPKGSFGGPDNAILAENLHVPVSEVNRSELTNGRLRPLLAEIRQLPYVVDVHMASPHGPAVIFVNGPIDARLGSVITDLDVEIETTTGATVSQQSGCVQALQTAVFELYGVAEPKVIIRAESQHIFLNVAPGSLVDPGQTTESFESELFEAIRTWLSDSDSCQGFGDAFPNFVEITYTSIPISE